MALNIKVKDQFKETVVGFNNSGKPLGDRNDLHLLIKDAKRTNHQQILEMFENIPSDEEIQNELGQTFEQKRAIQSSTTSTTSTSNQTAQSTGE